MKHKLTEQGLENFKNELDNLKNIERPRIIQAIADARAQGDLSENADYDVARNEQSRVEARIVELEEIVKNAVIIESSNKDNLGKKITIKIYKNAKQMKDLEFTFTLVSSNLESSMEPGAMKVSAEAPIGKAVLGARIGDEKFVKTEANSEQKIKIINIK